MGYRDWYSSAKSHASGRYTSFQTTTQKWKKSVGSKFHSSVTTNSKCPTLSEFLWKGTALVGGTGLVVCAAKNYCDNSSVPSALASSACASSYAPSNTSYMSGIGDTISNVASSGGGMFSSAYNSMCSNAASASAPSISAAPSYSSYVPSFNTGLGIVGIAALSLAGVGWYCWNGKGSEADGSGKETGGETNDTGRDRGNKVRFAEPEPVCEVKLKKD